MSSLYASSSRCPVFDDGSILLCGVSKPSEGLGFENVGTIEPPSDKPKGFQRFIRLFRKPAEEAAEEEAEGGTAGSSRNQEVINEVSYRVVYHDGLRLITYDESLAVGG